MYNIAKVAKGEILVYFNDVFDALCKLAADTELSVKNGAELLDRLVKDIVSESASAYESVVFAPQRLEGGDEDGSALILPEERARAFSLPRFIPLLQERINVLNPFTRTFLVGWITLLDSIPDLELVAYLPTFLGGLLTFLGDLNQDVHTTTRVALERFLTEIRKISAVKKGLVESRKGRGRSNGDVRETGGESPKGDVVEDGNEKEEQGEKEVVEDGDGDSTLTATDDDDSVVFSEEDEWIPGQSTSISYPQILEILVSFLSSTHSEAIQTTALRWIEVFLEICPEDILSFTPRLLATLLPALSHDVAGVKDAAGRVNARLMAYIVSLPEDGQGKDEQQEKEISNGEGDGASLRPSNAQPNGTDTATIPTIPRRPLRKNPTPEPPLEATSFTNPRTPDPPAAPAKSPSLTPPSPILNTSTELDYESSVNALTLQFLAPHESTRVAALAWLIMLHRKSPRRLTTIQSSTFPALLKTLSDPAEAVVTRDLHLLSQISRSSDDGYFTGFMVNLIRLFETDRRLLETRGNLIIRQLALGLGGERVVRTIAECLLDEDPTPSNPDNSSAIDIEFAAIMVQNLNNNLLTAPELSDLRKRLRHPPSDPVFFSTLFRAWSSNAVATFSLCLLAQHYEQAYHLLQIFADLEMSVAMLIQIDKLVQLLESPVFTYLRMQLLEPERWPYLYRCLYGVLMLLPQSSAFAALKNRLGSVCAIGYLGTGIVTGRGGTGPGVQGQQSGGVQNALVGGAASTAFGERQNRLKSRTGAGMTGDGGESGAAGGIRWNELLEGFRAKQERVRRAQMRGSDVSGGGGGGREEEEGSRQEVGGRANALALRPTPAPAGLGLGHAKGKSSLSLGRLTGAAATAVARNKGKK